MYMYYTAVIIYIYICIIPHVFTPGFWIPQYTNSSVMSLLPKQNTMKRNSVT